MGIFIVALGALFYCYEYFLRVAPGVMEPQMRSYFHIDATMFGTLSAFYFYAYTPMQLFVGPIVDHFRTRIVIIIALAACTVGILLMSDSGTFMLAAAGRFLQGFGSAFAFVAALKLASIWLPSERFALAVGACGSLGFFGAGASQIYLDALLQHLSWRSTLHTFVVLGVIIIVCVAITLMIKPPKVILERRNHKPPSVKLHFRFFIEVLKIKRIWLIAIFSGLVFLPTSVFAALWGIPYLQILDHYSHTEATIATAMIFVGWGIGAPLIGWISDHLHHRIGIIRIGTVIAAILSVPLLYLSSLPSWIVFLLFILFGIASSVQVLSFVIASDLSPSKNAAGTAIAFVNFLTMIGGLIFQRGVGQILDWDWSGKIVNGIRIYNLMDYEHAMIIVPGSLVIAVIISFFIKDSVKHPEKHR